MNQESVNQAVEQRFEDITEPSRALVANEAPEAAPVASHYRDAAFLAHLIATKVQAPQTRERRRAEPAVANAAYRAMAALA